MPFLSTTRKRAIAYYRHSAEDKQENSVGIQKQHIEKFAAKYNVEVIHEEADEGVSGLTDHRPAFQRLFDNWIENPEAPPFDYVLVYDVSRWGRFQDLEEATLYSIRCKRRGKKIIYVDQGFPREGDDFTDHLLIQFKRWKAADFSRELSGKVFWGGVEVTKQGYSAGGMPPFGLSRLLLNEAKEPVQVLKRGEHKMISNQRVTFIPSGDDASKIVEEIFILFTKYWHTPAEIAHRLNREDKLSTTGKPWNRERVVRILSNEAYCGSQVYNKTWSRLKKPQHSNPKSEWIVAPNAFEGIVSRETFFQAQEQLYWLMSPRWQRGMRAIQHVRDLVGKELDSLLTAKYSEEERWLIARQFPLLFSITLPGNSSPRWCFVIDEEHKRFDHVIGIGVDMNGKSSESNKCFRIPTEVFSSGRFIVFSQHDPAYREFLIEEEQLQEEITKLCNAIIQ